MSIGVACCAEHFAQDGRPAGDRQIQTLKDEYRSTFTHDESIAVPVERHAAKRRRNRRHVGETRNGRDRSG